ncbi:MAG TPA: hypothetical protein HA319_00690 [Nitrosopumilaceae archaeon]|jgi:hypothetical protein|nr:hypothetical protein [Nitrosopumilaceae archaeon]
MDFHPSQLPILKTFEINEELQVSNAVSEMIKLGFSNHKSALRVLMTNEKDLAKKIGFLIMNEINFGLRKTKQERDVMYWIYHHDKSRYAMILISSKVFHELGF